MTGLLMIAAFAAWLLYCFVFDCGGNNALDTDLHYAIPDLDAEAAPLNPTAAHDVAAVLATQAEQGGVASERSLKYMDIGDFVYIAIVIVFFAACVGYAYVCDRL
jgi:hypothetical protein